MKKSKKKIKKVARDKRHYTMIKGSIQAITIVNIYALNRGAPQHIRQLLTAIKGEIDSNTMIVEDFSFFFFCFLGHMEVPRLGIESELQLLAYATATATPAPSCICDLHQSSWEYWILNPLSKARD